MDRKEIVQISEAYFGGDVYVPASLDEANGSAYEVPATGEEIERWTAAVKLWRQAQEEMQARFKEAEQIAEAVYDVEASLRHEQYLKDEQDQQHQRAAEEKLADEVDGPREWVILRVGYRSSVRHTVHHVDCQVLTVTLKRRLKEEEELGDDLGRAMRLDEERRLREGALRLPEMALKVSRETWGRLVPCGRCASTVDDLVRELRASSN